MTSVWMNEPGPLVIRSWSDAHQKLIRCVLILDYQILLSNLLVWCQMPFDSKISEGIWSTSDDQRSRPISIFICCFRLRAIQISISHDQLNNRTISSNNDDQDLLGSSPPMTLGGQLATQPIMPIITQPRRPSIGRESFRQRNLGCVPQNLVFRGDSAAQIAPNLNIGK